MKIAFISDIHGNITALNAVLKDIKNKKIDKVFCLGDIIAKGRNSEECVQLVKKECDVVVRGNCDRHYTTPLEELNIKQEDDIKAWKLVNESLNEEEKKYLNELPHSFEFYLSGSLVRIYHSTPEIDNGVVISQDSIETKYKMFLPSEKTISDEVADIVVYGHIHHQYMEKLYNKTILNTGSVGNSFCLIRNPKKDSDIEEIRQANYVILEGDYGSKEYNDNLSIQFERVKYDVEEELSQEDYFQKDVFEYEVRNGTYRNMDKIKKNFARIGIDLDKF